MSRRKRKKGTQGTGGLGPRYGVTVRKRYNGIVSEMRRKHLCPQCSSRAVRRESVGIWVCSKCGYRFTGGSYVPTTKLGITAERSARSS